MMGTSVRDAQRRIDSREFAEWQAIHNEVPIGDEFIHYGMAIVAQVIAQAHSNGKRTFRVDEFLPYRSRRPGKRGILPQEKLAAVVVPVIRDMARAKGIDIDAEGRVKRNGDDRKS